MMNLLRRLLVLVCMGFPLMNASGAAFALTAPGPLLVLPEGGRSFYIEAFARAQRDIRIEICVLQDPEILEALQAALLRGVSVRVIVDQAKYNATSPSAPDSEAANLKAFLTNDGGELHLSNPIFPRSFPKIILIDQREVIVGSACLDSTTFISYRDFATRIRDTAIIKSLSGLFENDSGLLQPSGG